MIDLLDSVQFRAVPLLDVFDSMKASSAWYDKVHLKGGDGENLYLSQTLSGNSVAGIVADQDATPEPGNCITVTLKTQATFYQPVPFYTAQNFLIFRHVELNEATGLVLVAAMRKAFEKFSWGYGISMARLMRLRIVVPVRAAADGSDEADWETMQRFGEALLSRARGMAPSPSLNAPVTSRPHLSFEPWFITDVFESMKPAGGWFDLSKARTGGEAEYPYVARSDRSNGVVAFLPRQGTNPLNQGGGITIGVSTSTVFYQPAPFYTSKEIQVLRHPRLTAASGHVLVALLRSQVQKFQWGNGASIERLKATRMLVPTVADSAGGRAVDWDGMEQFGSWLLQLAETRQAEALEATS